MKKGFFYKQNDEIKQMTKDNLAGSWWYGAKNMMLYLFLSLAVTAGVVVPSVLNPKWYIIAPLCLVGLYLLCLLYYGYQTFCLNLSSKLSASTKDLFAGFGKKSFRIFKIMFMKFFIFIFGLVLAVFPLFMFELSYSMTSFSLYNGDKIKAGEALKQSKRLVKGNKSRLAKLRLSNIGWYLLCLTVIGALWALLYIGVSKAIFYNDLKTDF